MLHSGRQLRHWPGAQRSCHHAVANSRRPRAASIADALQLEPSPAQQQNHVLLYYRSTWSSAVLHGSLQGSPWQDYPMHQVRRRASALACRLRLTPATASACS